MGEAVGIEKWWEIWFGMSVYIGMDVEMSAVKK